jgi:hypothetical protein
MSRPALAVVGVVLVVATAGCGAVRPGADAARDPYAVPATGTTTATATATGTTTATGTVLAPDDLAGRLRSQADLLRSAGSYTLQFDRAVSVDGDLGNFRNETYRVDGRERAGTYFLRFLRGQRTGLSTVSVYRGDGVFRIKRTPPLGDDARFASLVDPEKSPENRSVSVLRREAEDLRGVALEPNGTAVFEGEEMQRYTAEGVGSVSAPAENYSDYRVVVLVDGRGLVRMVDERLVRTSEGGVRYVTQVRLAVTGVGSTTVPPPEWIGAANGTAG